ncbi:alpha/beta-hydrolase [Hypoxylon sp. FL0890]|nr:alpha/beta-hydrolase [Hypoxylon sp. FL0890]
MKSWRISLLKDPAPVRIWPGKYPWPVHAAGLSPLTLGGRYISQSTMESFVPSALDTQLRRWPTPKPGDFIITDFTFGTGERLPELHLHYQTLGTLRTTTSDDGRTTTNAVLIMHGTGGSSENFFNDDFAGQLFNAGQLLDASRYFIILRDGIGHGHSSKPSNTGLRARFPRYTYEDMIRADHQLLTQHLGVAHLRLALGTSMGGMHTWLLGGTYPGVVDALMPLASLPAPITGRNRMWRKMVIDAICADPSYRDGEYATDKPPLAGLTTAASIMLLMVSAPLRLQHQGPTRDAADRWLEEQIAIRVSAMDANDLIYALEASREYDPRPGLSRINVPLVAVNSADDEVNPPELGILEGEMKSRMKEGLGKAVVLPISEDTRGHSSHTIAVLWKEYLEELLDKTA